MWMNSRQFNNSNLEYVIHHAEKKKPKIYDKSLKNDPWNTNIMFTYLYRESLWKNTKTTGNEYFHKKVQDWWLVVVREDLVTIILFYTVWNCLKQVHVILQYAYIHISLKMIILRTNLPHKPRRIIQQMKKREKWKIKLYWKHVHYINVWWIERFSFSYSKLLLTKV